jgi:hypothetical protein
MFLPIVPPLIIVKGWANPFRKIAVPRAICMAVSGIANGYHVMNLKAERRIHALILGRAQTGIAAFSG